MIYRFANTVHYSNCETEKFEQNGSKFPKFRNSCWGKMIALNSGEIIMGLGNKLLH